MIENFPKLMTNTKLQTEQEAERTPNRIQKNLHVGMSYQKCQEKNWPMSHEKKSPILHRKRCAKSLVIR